MAKLKQTRGRLSSIDLLPEEAQPVVEQAMIDLREKKKPQTIIFQEFNNGLEELGLDLISKSAFNRKAVAIARHGNRMQELAEISKALGEKIEKLNESDVGKFLVETLRCMLYDAMSDADLSGQAGVAMIGKAANALKNMEQALNLNVHSTKLVRTHFAEAIDIAEKEGGLTKKQADNIRDGVFGVRKKEGDDA